MTTTTSLYAVCQQLFADYPLAVKKLDPQGAAFNMVLMLEGPGEPEFFIISYWAGGPYSLARWRGDEVPDGQAEGILSAAVPLPRDGSMFGWLDQGEVTATMIIYARYSPKHPVPGWAVSALAGRPEEQWPPFTGLTLADSRFWDHYRAGQIVDLAPLVAETPGSVFWVQAPAPLHACCAVAHDVTAPQGWVLPQGVYVWYQSLRDGEPVPSLADLLADPSKTDLAPRFQED